MPAPKKTRKRVRIQRPEVIYDYYGKPLNTTIARSHVVEMFVKRPAWNRAALIKAIEEAHSQAGGVEGTRDPMMCVNDALKGLKIAGIVNNEVTGLWRLVGKLPAMVRHNEQVPLEMEIEAPFSEVAPVVAKAVEVPTATEIGEGEETISVLYDPNDQRLAELEGRSRWECRISKDLETPQPFSRKPIVGLVIRCENAIEMEAVLKASLKIAKREIPDALDSDWFYTSPDAVKHWFVDFRRSLDQFSGAR
ncbi:MAG: hypothetical protein EOP10_06800 [Proteobacteria bacterium]|nr:MAG: hypothetical protein EOP10_06800 [Pseudomonadota bacterium]